MKLIHWFLHPNICWELGITFDRPPRGAQYTALFGANVYLGRRILLLAFGWRKNRRYQPMPVSPMLLPIAIPFEQLQRMMQPGAPRRSEEPCQN